MTKFLRNLYKKFLVFDKEFFLRDVKNWLGVKDLKLGKKILPQFFENYQKISFVSFLKDIKDIIYSKNIFDFIPKNSVDDWYLWYQLKFLEEEKVINVERNGKIFVLKKEILNLIPRPMSEEEIKNKIEEKLKIKVREREPVINLFKKFSDFKVKAKFDQLPISQGSAIFVVKKILEYLPLTKKFLFVGDDDFVSVILGLANPDIESTVADIDTQILDCLNYLSSKFNLKINTKKTDLSIPHQRNLGGGFIGFLTNPVYTEEGAKEFIRYGVSQLSEDGGFGFLEIGNEAIGNRLLFLQDFFVKNNLIIKELIPNKIYYPWILLHKEDKIINKRLKLMFDEKVIRKSPKLGASLYILNYLPFKIRKIKFKKPIYSYL